MKSSLWHIKSRACFPLLRVKIALPETVTNCDRGPVPAARSEIFADPERATRESGKISSGRANHVPAHGPGLLTLYKAAPGLRSFLRTYSVRIYFIVSNSSLACLHMPHPSNPLDDIRARSSHREHVLREEDSMTFGRPLLCALRGARRACQRAGRLSDGFLSSLLRVLSDVTCYVICNALLFLHSHWTDQNATRVYSEAVKA